MFLYQMGEVNNSYDYVTDVPVTSNVDAKYLFLHNATNKIGLCWPGTHGEPIS